PEAWRSTSCGVVPPFLGKRLELPKVPLPPNFLKSAKSASRPVNYVVGATLRRSIRQSDGLIFPCAGKDRKSVDFLLRTTYLASVRHPSHLPGPVTYRVVVVVHGRVVNFRQLLAVV